MPEPMTPPDLPSAVFGSVGPASLKSGLFAPVDGMPLPLSLANGPGALFGLLSGGPGLLLLLAVTGPGFASCGFCGVGVGGVGFFSVLFSVRTVVGFFSGTGFSTGFSCFGFSFSTAT